MNLQQILSDIPDCPNVFNDYDHRPMVVTNELNYHSVIEDNRYIPVYGNLMVAVSTFYCLDLAAVRENVEYLLILDRSVRVNRFWMEVREILVNARVSGNAKNRIIRVIEENKELYYSGSTRFSSSETAKDEISELLLVIERGFSWLSDERRFKRIQSLFLEGRVAFKRLDLCDSIAMESLGAALKAHSLALDIFYISNVREYALEENRGDDLYKGIESLLTSNCCLIDAFRYFKNHPWILMQRALQAAPGSVKGMFEEEFEGSSQSLSC